jgi:hypothetical protein
MCLGTGRLGLTGGSVQPASGATPMVMMTVIIGVVIIVMILSVLLIAGK